MQNNESIKKYAKLFLEKKLIECGYIALRESDGILITQTKADFANLSDEDIVFVNYKNIDSFEGNFRAAAVILFCAIRQDKCSESAVIADSDAILKYSSKRKPLLPILDEVAQLCGLSVKCATKNVAAEIVTSLSGQRNACFMPDAGAVIKARSLEEVLYATSVLDKACTAQLLADGSGNDTQHINMFGALVEQLVYKFKTAKSAKKAKTATESAVTEKSENQPSAQPDAVAEQQSEEAEQSQQPEQTEQPDEMGEEKKSELGDAVEFALFKDDSQEEVALLMHPFYGSILSAMGKPMPVPEKFAEELGEEIPCASSAMTCTKKAVKNVCEVIGEAPACFIAGHGVVVRGTDRDDAISVCRTLEEACKVFLENK